MLFGYLLTNTAQIFADVRTYWSPDAVRRVTGHELTGAAARRRHPPDQLRRGALDGTRPQRRDGQPAMKPFWEITPKRRKRASRPRPGTRPTASYFRGGGFSSAVRDRGRHAGDHVPHQPGEGPGPRAADRRGLDGGPAAEVHRVLDAHRPDVADHLVRAAR